MLYRTVRTLGGARHEPALCLSLFVLGACTLVIPLQALAETSGRMLHLQATTPLDKSRIIELAQREAAQVPQASRFSAAPAPLVAAPTSVGLRTGGDPDLGCVIDPSSPAIGANVPSTYFGIPGPTTNPSLVGAVQLLTAGQLDLDTQTITLPLYRGVMAGSNENVWYISTDTTDEANAQALGINFSAKLAFAETRRGVRRAYLRQDGLLVFSVGTVDFTPERVVVSGGDDAPFPPAVAEPGGIGDNYYTPLVRIINAGDHIYNLPVVAFGSSAEEINFPDGDIDYSLVHDSVVAIDPFNQTVTLALVPGFSFARPVLYLSTESNDATTAALEGGVLAPGLDDVTVGADDSLFSAVERIFAFSNGPRGCENPQRQGLDAAIADGATPFNVLGGIPTIATDYSPLWDLNLGEWTQEAIESGYRSRLNEEFQILFFAENGFITGPQGAEYGSTGAIINCPIVHRFL